VLLSFTSPLQNTTAESCKLGVITHQHVQLPWVIDWLQVFMFGITITLTDAGLAAGPGFGLAPVGATFEYLSMLRAAGGFSCCCVAVAAERV
jgi:hypothetical protein